MSNRLLFLGTGASTGIPVVGCSCEVCSSSDTRNRRLRTSVFITWEGKRLLLDVGPDFRQQALRADIRDLDGVLITHPHYDHIGGLDELRVFFIRNHAPIPCLLSQSCLQELNQRYEYLFRPPSAERNVVAQFIFQTLQGERGTADFVGLPIRYFTFSQGGIEVSGFRLGDMAFVSDICEYPETIFEDLKGIRILILSALRFEPSHVHLTVDQAVEFARRCEAEQTWFVHMGHELEHQKAERTLPDDIRLSYDGLEIIL